jgi:hypothetical protein
MIRSPKYATAVVALLFGFACAAAGAAQIAIISPVQQDTIHDNSGNMVVKVEVEPAIDRQKGTLVRILLDGNPAAPDSKGMSFTLEGVERGEHWLQALLIDAQGQTTAVSATIHFTMWQASVNAPPRKPKPRPKPN